jgi:hypothetical protein
MKTYVGTRLDEGCEVYVVDVDGRRRPLATFEEIRNHSPDGFEWGYHGSGPAQLALAILADHFGPQPAPSVCPHCETSLTDEDRCPECLYDHSKECWHHIQGGVIHYQEFKRSIVAHFSKPGFELTDSQITDWVSNHRKQAEQQ